MNKCPCCGSDLADADRPLVSLETNKLLAGAEVTQLSRREAEIMHILASRMPVPVDYETFASKLYGDISTESATSTLKVQVSRLRPRLLNVGLNVRAVYGGGYVLEYTKARAA
mgnify:CR=1 FL=1